MSDSVFSNLWGDDAFRESLATRIVEQIRTSGGYFRNTMASGELDRSSKTVKFAKLNPVNEGYEVTNIGIEDVPSHETGWDIETLSMRFFEAVEFFDELRLDFSPDMLKTVVANAMSAKILDMIDGVQWSVINSFYSANTSIIDTVGDGSASLTPYMIDTAVGQIMEQGDNFPDGTEFYLPLPALDFKQLMQHKLMSNADYIGPDDLPFKGGRLKKAARYSNVVIMSLPNKPLGLTAGTTDPFYTYLWMKDAFGAEFDDRISTPEMDRRKDLKGQKIQCKILRGGNCVGLVPQGVRRFHLAKATDVAEVPQLTQAVS